jgi:Ca2+/Na+ antiporter
MKDFDHLLSVWQGQPKQEQLSVENTLKQAKKGMNSISRKLYWSITAMIASLVLMASVMLFLVFESWVTYTGIIIMLSTMVLYTMTVIRDYKLIHKQDVTTNPSEYLEALKEYQRRRSNLFGWVFYLYVVMLSIGLSLYFYEVMQSASLVFKIIVYTITVSWILFCTFYLKKRIFITEQEKVNGIIDRLMRLKGQFE